MTDPNQPDRFIDSLNDFLRAARAVPEFLAKEPRGPVKRIPDPAKRKQALLMKDWLEGYLKKLPELERDRYKYLIKLREVSSHHHVARPDLGEITISDVRKSRASRQGNLADQHEFGSADAPNIIEAVAGIKYHFKEWSAEDVLSFCREVLRILETLVDEAYRVYL
jgi:hypothetical protein